MKPEAEFHRLRLELTSVDARALSGSCPVFGAAARASARLTGSASR
jgi:hypothetical protein